MLHLFHGNNEFCEDGHRLTVVGPPLFKVALELAHHYSSPKSIRPHLPACKADNSSTLARRVLNGATRHTVPRHASNPSLSPSGTRAGPQNAVTTATSPRSADSASTLTRGPSRTR